MRWVLSALGTLLLAAFVVACKETPSNLEAKATNTRVFQVKGTIKEIRPEGKKVRIAHEKIPGYMEAMTMEFDVTNATELAGLTTNDLVSFRMIVTEKEGWIDQIKKVGVSPITESPSPDGFRRAREVEPLNLGDSLPDYQFTNEFGQPFHLRDFKGQALGITFIFTRCPYPNFCPRLSSNFAETHKTLKTLPDAPTNWHLLTVSFDPEFDTPATLRRYAQGYNYDSNHWTFATGELIDITALAEQFGLYFWKENNTISHNVRTVVIDATGHVQWTTNQNEWKPELLVEQMLKAARSK